MSNIYLQHHGVKGMRWGVRRNQNGLESTKRKPKYHNLDKKPKTKLQKGLTVAGITIGAIGALGALSFLQEASVSGFRSAGQDFITGAKMMTAVTLNAKEFINLGK